MPTLYRFIVCFFFVSFVYIRLPLFARLLLNLIGLGHKVLARIISNRAYQEQHCKASAHMVPEVRILSYLSAFASNLFALSGILPYR